MLDLLALDRELLWHPYTSMVSPTPTRLVLGANGVRLRLSSPAAEQVGDDGWVIDAMSSWWSAIHGYRHPALDAALTQQAAEFAHVMFGGLTHEPAIRLAQRLTELTGLDHVFLADSGSVAVEVALKMARQYQRGVGQPQRTKLLTVAGGYHGDTLGCMSVCDPIGGMHTMFADVVPRQHFGPRPPGYDAVPDEVAAWRTELARLAASPDVAAIVLEPLLQGAGGMHPYPPEHLRYLRELADQFGLLLITDEIATGFGRTGADLFATHTALGSPGADIICVGKALTGGYLTLAATLCTRAVGDGIAGSESGVLMHGPTYMGNPLACTVALASLELLTSNDWQRQVSAINQRLSTGLAHATQLPGVKDVRTLGAVGVLQLDHPVDVPLATEVGLRHGVWIRPFRDLIYTMPPYVCSAAEIDQICAAMLAAAEVS